MDDFASAAWYVVRRAGSTKPATYRCPLYRRHLPALSEHLLVLPLGDPRRRRHAHTACVVAARKAGGLRFHDEVHPRPPGALRRLLRTLRGQSSEPQ